ncbi:MAG: hypothetical protein HZB10_03650 [Candidatus Yonathbacteria bacterium]|nr:hypothetical protein [Candidatus Yonathbacteria bacterium]
MKIFVSLETVAVAIVMILLAHWFAFHISPIIESKRLPEKNRFIRENLHHAAIIRQSDMTECIYIGDGIFHEFQANKKLREEFFAEFSEFIAEKHTAQVLEIEIKKSEQICIRYIKKEADHNPNETLLARLN